jgi:hypothetical protein
MNEKPSDNEEEYFARLEIERRRQIAGDRQAAIITEERERERALHLMRCPKCGMQLEEIAFDDVRIDKCFGCEGIWLDNGELDVLRKKEPGFVGTLLNLFR